MARTDARAGLGLEEALERCKEFRRIGADITFLEAPQSEEEMQRYCQEVDGPKLANMLEVQQIHRGFFPRLSPFGRCFAFDRRYLSWCFFCLERTQDCVLPGCLPIPRANKYAKLTKRVFRRQPSPARQSFVLSALTAFAVSLDSRTRENRLLLISSARLPSCPPPSSRRWATRSRRIRSAC